MEFPKKLAEVIRLFKKLPGFGEKSAIRQAIFLSTMDHADLEKLSLGIRELIHLKKCDNCGVYLDNENCLICSSENRKREGVLCIVENYTDFLAIERSGHFKGSYHVLGGVLNPLLGIGPDELKIDRLLNRFDLENITTVLLAINPSVEGDATCSYIKNILPENIVVERIGMGIPVGGSLEYLDALTISKALENKKKV